MYERKRRRTTSNEGMKKGEKGKRYNELATVKTNTIKF